MQYNPHDYQDYATDFVLTHPYCGLILDMGLGKSVITLTALWDLVLDSFDCGRVLVIAPKRVAEDTWPKELAKWDHLKGLSYTLVMGTEKQRREALRRKAFLYIINRENVAWLVDNYRWDFDAMVIDELSSFKSSKAQRFRALKRVRPLVKRVIGLTGTPAPNTLIDLWPQIYLLDMGKRLGRFITGYRDRFFTPDKRNREVVYSYKLREGAEQRIYELISDLCISMKATDHLKMPELISNRVEVHLSSPEHKQYDAGLDLSSTSDLTTLVLVFPPESEDEPYIVLPFFWLPEETLSLRVRRDHVMYDVWKSQQHLMTTEGNVVHYGFIERFICDLGERYNIREIAYDRWNATMMVQALEDDGFTMIPFGQGFKDMSPPTKELMRIVLERKLNHGGHPVLRWNMDNAFVRTDPAGNLKIDKEKSTEKVDGAVALVMALDRAMKNLTSGSVYDERGLLFV